MMRLTLSKPLPGAAGCLAAALLGVLPMTTTFSSPAAAAGITQAPGPFKKSIYAVEIVAEGLENPWGLQFMPDGRLLVTERPGRLRIVTRDGRVLPRVKGIPAVLARNQGGLLDVALAADFATSGAVFLAYSEPRETGRNGTAVLRARLVEDAQGARLEDQVVIFRQMPSIGGGYHFGARIVVTADGSLFIGLGDRFTQRDEAQNPANHLGKVIRINADGTPFAGNPKRPGWAPDVWSIGHRNIQGAALHPVTGDLWITEHGPQGGDELNRPEAGKNYGWPVITYGEEYGGGAIGIGTRKEGLEQPVYYWRPSIATSGLAFYSGPFAAWRGNLFAGALAGTHVARLMMIDGKVAGEEQLLADRGWRIRDVRDGPDGALWVLTDEFNGMVVRIVPKG